MSRGRYDKNQLPLGETDQQGGDKITTANPKAPRIGLCRVCVQRQIKQANISIYRVKTADNVLAYLHVHSSVRAQTVQYMY